MSHDERALPSDSVAQGEARVDRRHLFRRGALIAGAAGAASLALAAPTPAQAVDGDNLELGAENGASSTTTLALKNPVGGPDPTLALLNGNGPSLNLQALAPDFDNGLQLGDVANTEIGPLVGVDSELGLTTTYLATGIDLADLPTPYPLPAPERLLDTRTTSGRARVIRTSASAWDSAHRLRKGAWIDVEVATVTGEFEIPGAWLNVTCLGPKSGGHVKVYPPGPVPVARTLSFPKSRTVSNGAFVATDIVSGRYAVRLYTTSTTHLVLDLTGVLVKGAAPVPAVLAEGKAARRSSNASKATLTRRLRSTLTDKFRATRSR
jgi:hypothetical protein